MREINFRLWDKKNKKFIEDDFFIYEDGTPYKYGMFETMGELYDCVVEQFTGLKDKNGKKIFEGDIVRCHTSYGTIFRAEIVFNDGCFEVYRKYHDSDVFRDYIKCLTCNHALAVIGNIHQNPELLTGK